jgi:hypothetical protein
MAHKHEFEPLQRSGHFASEVGNVFIVVDHFERRLQLNANGSEPASVDMVLEVIRDGGHRLPSSQLKVRAVRAVVYRVRACV